MDWKPGKVNSGFSGSPSMIHLHSFNVLSLVVSAALLVATRVRAETHTVVFTNK